MYLLLDEKELMSVASKGIRIKKKKWEKCYDDEKKLI